MKRSVILLCLLATILLFQSCKLGRFVYYNFADITDYKIFPSRSIQKGTYVFTFPTAKAPKIPKHIVVDSTDYWFEDYIKSNKTVAFIIIKNDSIQYEKYFDNYEDSSVVASFSMAKSITSLLIGIAIDEGKIKSIEEPITNYIPELKANGFDAVKIKHLLQMTSGLDFKEAYTNPFGQVANFYYGTNLRAAIKKLKLKETPGTSFEYTSGTTQLLGLVLERSLKDQTISAYLEEKVWQPLGMEYDATWSLDRKKDGLEKTFCCINARARDFAKIGRLYLNKGKWNGKRIVSSSWVKASTTINSQEGSSWNYQQQWWLPTKDGDFLADGLLGQYIYVHPKKNLIMLRLGKRTGDVNWKKFLPLVAQHY